MISGNHSRCAALTQLLTELNRTHSIFLGIDLRLTLKQTAAQLNEMECRCLVYSERRISESSSESGLVPNTIAPRGPGVASGAGVNKQDFHNSRWKRQWLGTTPCRYNVMAEETSWPNAY